VLAEELADDPQPEARRMTLVTKARDCAMYLFTFFTLMIFPFVCAAITNSNW
jgi:hypothetical protein